MHWTMMQLEARDKRALIGGSAVVVALLAYLLWPSTEDPTAVELVAADQRQGAAAPAPAMQVPPPNSAATPPPVAPVAAPAAMPEGITLVGVAGSGAIFSFKDGGQRFVGRGRPVAPGIVLQGVALRHVILAAGPTSYRLGFGGVPTPLQASAGPVVAARTPRPDLARETALYRQALTPHRVNGDVVGYQLAGNVPLPVLQRAGLRPGDILVSVNGNSVDSSEKVSELAGEIHAAKRADIQFIRDGQTQRVIVDVSGNQ